MGFIYIITSTKTIKVYIGQTKKAIEKRWKKHLQNVQDLKKYLEQNGDSLDTSNEYYMRLRSSILYRSMLKHGVDTFEIEMLEELPNDKKILNDAEKRYIQEFDSMAPNGLNATSGGDSLFEHSDQSKQLMRDAKRVNLDKTRNAKLEGFPPYTTYEENHPSDGERVCFQNHPFCKFKSFTMKKHGSMENIKVAMWEFINALEAEGKPYKRQTKSVVEGYPGLYQIENGYFVWRRYKKQLYNKHFTDKSLTFEENKKRALEYYNLNFPK